MKHANVLVLGGAGYVGSVVVEKLLQKGYNVVVYDNLSKGHKESVECTFINGDISDKKLLDHVMSTHKIDAVMHFCALSIVPESVVNPRQYFENNVVFGLNILNSMLDNGVKKIIFSSSAAVYGNPIKVPINEDDPLVPINPYGETKLMFERLLRWYAECYGISYVALRYFNAAGASPEHGEDHDPETHLIPIVLDVAQGKRKLVKVFGTDYPTKDRTCVRDYIHVLDLASAHILALEHKGSGVFNLGNGKGYSVKEVIDTVGLVTGKKIPTEFAPRREGDPPVLVASYDRAKKILGWQPRYGLKEIISSAWEWKTKYPQGY